MTTQNSTTQKVSTIKFESDERDFLQEIKQIEQEEKLEKERLEERTRQAINRLVEPQLDRLGTVLDEVSRLFTSLSASYRGDFLKDAQFTVPLRVIRAKLLPKRSPRKRNPTTTKEPEQNGN